MTIDPYPDDAPRDLASTFRVAALQQARAKDDKGAEQLRRWADRVNAEPGPVLDELLALARKLRRPVHCRLLRVFTVEEFAAASERSKRTACAG